MKSFALLAFGAAIVAAQDTSGLPACGQTCIANMLAQASALGCPNGASDPSCLCSNADFGYGIRDCSNEACGNAADAGKVIAFGEAYCAAIASASSGASTGALSVLTSALATVSGASSLLASASGAVTASATGSGAGGASSTAITTEPLVATVVSGSQTILQTTGFNTIYSAISGAASSGASSLGSAASSATGSLASQLSSLSGSAASAASSVEASASSALASISGAESSLASSLSSAAHSGASSTGGAASSSSSGGAMPMMTAAPFAGAGVAGMAALLLL